MIALLAIRAALAITFFHAGVVKIWDFTRQQSSTPAFALAVQQYALISSPDLRLALAIYLPWLEVIVAICLFVPRLRLGALMALLGMTTMFLGALLSAWQRGLELSCGCFGSEENPADFRAVLLRDLTIFAAIVGLLIWERRRLLAPEVRRRAADGHR